jgi:hypothetical protein
VKLILITLVAVLVGLMVACSSTNIEATVEARLAQERGIEATVEARLAEEKAAKPTPVPTIRRPATRVPTPTKDFYAYANLKKRWKDMLTYYVDTPKGGEYKRCLNFATGGITIGFANQASAFYVPPSPLASFAPKQDDYWIIEVSGTGCKGIEKWHIDDDTGEVTYQGNSLDGYTGNPYADLDSKIPVK